MTSMMGRTGEEHCEPDPGQSPQVQEHYHQPDLDGDTITAGEQAPSH